jgi:hypothetical protein
MGAKPVFCAATRGPARLRRDFAARPGGPRRVGRCPAAGAPALRPPDVRGEQHDRLRRAHGVRHASGPCTGCRAGKPTRSSSSSAATPTSRARAGSPGRPLARGRRQDRHQKSGLDLHGPVRTALASFGARGSPVTSESRTRLGGGHDYADDGRGGPEIAFVAAASITAWVEHRRIMGGLISEYRRAAWRA